MAFFSRLFNAKPFRGWRIASHRPMVTSGGTAVTPVIAVNGTMYSDLSSDKEGHGMKLVLLAVLGAGLADAATVMAPRFEVDLTWPKPLPNHWILGSAIGVATDSKDHVWIIHRPGSLEPGEVHATTNPAIAQCCAPAPPVLEFDQAGNLLRHWGGPGKGFDWPVSNHGITIDYKGNVWIGGNNRTAEAGPEDDAVLKFTQDGQFVMQIGKPGQSKGSNDVENFKQPAKIFIDPKTNEVYIADGYGNHRVIVFDADSGIYKRHWGAYGHKPDDVSLGPYKPSDPAAAQFRNPVHCAQLSNDGLLYVCDRVNDRIQVFKPDGTFVKEAFIERGTLGSGAAWDIAFSRDPEQKFIYLADGENDKVHILDRGSLEVLTSFGQGGRQPGEFYGVHSIATDSKGNIYTTETYRGQRVQRFVYKGLAPVTTKDQGVLWPKK
jgi:DNA-binding beta-propeller fold protein YncE